jgi:hypothetical protein
MLDHWICKSALSWSWEEERYLFEEVFLVIYWIQSLSFPPDLSKHGLEPLTSPPNIPQEFESEIRKLRSALFPELKEEDGLNLDKAKLSGNDTLDDENDLNELMEVVDWSDVGMNEKVHTHFKTIGK